MGVDPQLIWNDPRLVPGAYIHDEVDLYLVVGVEAAKGGFSARVWLEDAKRSKNELGVYIHRHSMRSPSIILAKYKLARAAVDICIPEPFVTLGVE